LIVECPVCSSTDLLYDGEAIECQECGWTSYEEPELQEELEREREEDWLEPLEDEDLKGELF